MQRNQRSNCKHPLDHRKENSRKNSYFCFIDYIQNFDCVDHNKLWNILKEMRIPAHLICLLRNLYEFQEDTVRTGLGTRNWFYIEKGVRQGCILSSVYLTNIQSTLCKMPGWMKQKLSSRFQEKYQ